jgi:sec-independent protein translocase protein TatA
MGIGTSELMIIFLVALLLFGAKKLPELARGVGKAMGEFKAARREFEEEIRRAECEVKEEPKRIPQQSPAPSVPRSEPHLESGVSAEGTGPDDARIS